MSTFDTTFYLTQDKQSRTEIPVCVTYRYLTAEPGMFENGVPISPPEPASAEIDKIEIYLDNKGTMADITWLIGAFCGDDFFEELIEDILDEC